MANLKIPPAHMATGYWGRDMATHIHLGLQTPERILALHRDQIFGMGLPYKLWTKPYEIGAHNIQCSCWKDTTQQSDLACLSCYGLRYQPGYYRFGHNTIFCSSITPGCTLANVELNKTVTPFRLQLVNGALSGTILTPTYAISTQNFGYWESRLDAFIRDNVHNTITCDVTVDGGITWQDLSILGTDLLNPTTGATLQFRITMTRQNTAAVSPLFEILRARYPTVPSPRTRLPLPASPGDILTLKTWDQERFRREISGQQIETENERHWTLPLSFFDPSIDREDAKSVIGQHHFLEECSGPEAGTRYISVKHAYSRTYKIFTHQAFNMRRVIGDINQKTTGETINRVF